MICFKRHKSALRQYLESQILTSTPRVFEHKMTLLLLGRCFWIPIMCQNCAKRYGRIQSNIKQSLILEELSTFRKMRYPWNHLKTTQDISMKNRIRYTTYTFKALTKSMFTFKKFKMAQKSTVKRNVPPCPTASSFPKGHLGYELLVQLSGDGISLRKLMNNYAYSFIYTNSTHILKEDSSRTASHCWAVSGNDCIVGTQ